ncbi:MAG: FecR family protein [Bacteroidales bacterium]|nr:FecR family protein [Bacteroidales bacterium]
MNNAEFKNDAIELLIISYLTGSISERDLVRLQEWINVSKENRDYFNILKDSWILSGEKNKDSFKNNEESWNKFSHKLSDTRLGLKRQEEVNLTKYLKLAASWLLIFSLGSAVTWWITGSQKKKASTTTAENRTIEISTPLGARSMIKMPDSTQIWLNAGTTITYSEDYGHQTRTLHLNGEAYFKVSKDTRHPFIVNTQGIIIRALGTSFNVKAYPEENTISATLEEGKIDVRTLNMAAKDEHVLLNPKEKLIYHKETKETERSAENSEEKIRTVRGQVKLKEINILSNVRTELYTSWKDARWIIDREPFRTLAPMLERRFNLKIIFDDEQLKNLKFTGIIENETVDQILKAVKLTAPIDYRINKDTLRLSLDLASKEEFKRITTIKN